MRTLVVMRGQRFESLLARCVPQDDLYFVWTMLEDDFPCAKLNGYSGSESLRRHRILHVPVDKCCLTNSRFANEYDFDHLTELLYRLCLNLSSLHLMMLVIVMITSL